MRWKRVLLIAIASSACEGIVKDGRPTTPGVVATECTTPAVFEALSTTCATCHGAGTNKPYFSSVQSFEALLVSKPQWVVPGKPDEGQLLPILRGEAPGTFPQMPPGELSASFAAQAEAGKAAPSMETLRCWIEGLTGSITTTSAGPLPVARRLSAEQMLAALEQQLGVSGTANSMSTFGLSLPDAIPSTDVYGQRDQNHAALGGPHWLENRRRNDSVNPVFIQTFVNVSQVYCRAAVNAPMATNRVLKFASGSDTTTSAAPKIRDNIRYLGKLLLSQSLSDADVEDYFQLFKALEASRVTAWTAVCAAMVRDPLWMTY